MFRNYFKIALRNLSKQKLYSFINIFGLAIAIAFCILIILFVRDEMTHDSFHEKADRLYRVNVLSKNDDGRLSSSALCPPPLGPAFLEEFPEIVHMSRFIKRGDVVNYQGQSARESIALADPDFFKMFSFRLNRGDPQTVLLNRDSVIIREEIVKRYFGKEDPIGKVLSIKMGSRFFDFIVSGVAGDIPQSSSITFDFLVPYDRVRDYIPERYLSQWTGFTTSTFIELQRNVSAAELGQKFPSFVRKHLGEILEKYAREDFSAYRFELQPLQKIYLNTEGRSYYMASSNPLYSYILSGIALLILIIAAINYMNLAIARYTTRLREIGMRKVLGADRKNLMKQFFSESIFFSFISLLVGIALAELFLPAFNNFVGKKLAIGYFSNWTTMASIIGLMFVVSLVSGSYPALFLSRFRPADVLRSQLRIGGKSRFSRWLVIVQFTLSVFLIISTIFMSRQLTYMKKRDLGIRGEQVVIISTQGSPKGTQLVDRFRNELDSYKNILSVSGSSMALGNDGSYVESVVRDQKSKTMAHYFFIDFDFFKTIGAEVIEGRDFSKTYTSDPQESVIANESLVNEMGWDSAVGKQIRTFMGRKDPLTVIGVVKDFHFESMHAPISPAIFYIEPHDQLDYIYVKISPDDIPRTLRLLRETWKQGSPNLPFMYSFLDEEFQRLYAAEERWSAIVGYASVFAVIISCLGLFGLSALAIARRTKEIGIRKVLGASVTGLARLVSMDFLKLVIFANIIAWPLAYYAMNRWLRSFAFRIDVEIWVFLLAAILSGGIAVLTLSYQAVKAALADPVESLRFE
jgi:putative ABC transport system permease protein